MDWQWWHFMIVYAIGVVVGVWAAWRIFWWRGYQAAIRDIAEAEAEVHRMFDPHTNGTHIVQGSIEPERKKEQP